MHRSNSKLELNDGGGRNDPKSPTANVRRHMDRQRKEVRNTEGRLGYAVSKKSPLENGSPVSSRPIKDSPHRISSSKVSPMQTSPVKYSPRKFAMALAPVNRSPAKTRQHQRGLDGRVSSDIANDYRNRSNPPGSPGKPPSSPADGLARGDSWVRATDGDVNRKRIKIHHPQEELARSTNLLCKQSARKSTMIDSKEDANRRRRSQSVSRKNTPVIDVSSNGSTRLSTESNSSNLSVSNSTDVRSVGTRPSEVLRRDLISAMQLPDGTQLSRDQYWVILDRWKAEWERGVYVPFENASARAMYPCQEAKELTGGMMKICRADPDLDSEGGNDTDCDDAMVIEDDFDQRHQLVANLYNNDAMDLMWLEYIRSMVGTFEADKLEKLIIAFEFTALQRMTDHLSKQVTYDDNIVCDVCKSPESSPNDEIVFCDGCNMCAHQSCYGIGVVPSGSWVCSPCSRGVTDLDCVLCPNKGGAFKPVAPEGARQVGHNQTLIHDANTQLWAHLCCALWVPETTVRNSDTMELIEDVCKIPNPRWSLVCSLCKVRSGACIQCTLPTCRSSFHVSCAFKKGLQMDIKFDRQGGRGCRAVVDHTGEDNGQTLRFIAYCHEHSDQAWLTERSKAIKHSSMEVIADRRRKAEKEFHRFVDPTVIASATKIDQLTVDSTFSYWKDRRETKKGPLIPNLPATPTCDIKLWASIHSYLDMEVDDHFVRRRMHFLRQELETVRNLCYMIIRRERIKHALLHAERNLYIDSDHSSRSSSPHRRSAQSSDEEEADDEQSDSTIGSDEESSMAERIVFKRPKVDHMMTASNDSSRTSNGFQTRKRRHTVKRCFETLSRKLQRSAGSRHVSLGKPGSLPRSRSRNYMPPSHRRVAETGRQRKLSDHAVTGKRSLVCKMNSIDVAYIKKSHENGAGTALSSPKTLEHVVNINHTRAGESPVGKNEEPFLSCGGITSAEVESAEVINESSLNQASASINNKAELRARGPNKRVVRRPKRFLSK